MIQTEGLEGRGSEWQHSVLSEPRWPRSVAKPYQTAALRCRDENQVRLTLPSLLVKIDPSGAQKDSNYRKSYIYLYKTKIAFCIHSQMLISRAFGFFICRKERNIAELCRKEGISLGRLNSAYQFLESLPYKRQLEVMDKVATQRPESFSDIRNMLDSSALPTVVTKFYCPLVVTLYVRLRCRSRSFLFAWTWKARKM